jgi:hypothetical protein
MNAERQGYLVPELGERGRPADGVSVFRDSISRRGAAGPAVAESQASE